MQLIDPPSPFADLASWQSFLEGMERSYEEVPDDAQIRDALKEARRMVRMKRKHGDRWCG